jgi:hypothetical protein
MLTLWSRLTIAGRAVRHLLRGDIERRALDLADVAGTRAGELEARVMQLESDLTTLAIQNHQQAEENEIHGYLVAALTEELVRFRGESQRKAIVDRVSAYVNERARLAQAQRVKAEREARLAAAQAIAPAADDQGGAQEAPAEAAPAAQQPAAPDA